MTAKTPSALLKRLFLIIGLVILAVIPHNAGGFQDIGSPEENRARLIAYLIRQELASHHFILKEIDDAFSRDAFGLFLKQLDPQKRFLLQDDVKRLSELRLSIDDELKGGAIQLAPMGEEILLRRIGMVRDMIRSLLSQDFDFSASEQIETDPKKLDFCSSEDELRERWRKALKSQVLNRYLTMMDDEAKDAGKEAGGPKPAAKPKPSQKEAREKLLKSYDKIFSKTLHEKSAEGYNRFFDAVAKTFDPHTDYMPPANKEDFDISMRGSLEGIGATLKDDEGFIKVVSIVPGSPAYRQGQLQVDDIILKVGERDQEPADITDMELSDAVKLIRGKKGTEVRLTIRKTDGTQLVIPIVRDVIKLEDASVKGTIIHDDKSGKDFGYIKVPSFYRDFEGARKNGSARNVTSDISVEIKKLGAAGISGLVLDLRNNGGGALTDAVNTTGLFIKTGPVVQVKSSGGRVTQLSDDDPSVLYGGPLVVLVNRISASASEILAAALQDYGRAVIIGGDRTFGKGTVQTMIDLDARIPFTVAEKYRPIGTLRLTTQKFYRISGGSTQNRGVAADIVVPDRFRAFKGEEEELDFAMPWDSIGQASFERWDGQRLDIPSLRAKSAARVAANSEFAKISKVTQLIVERQNRTLQSLQIDEVRKEREEMKAEDSTGTSLHGGQANKKRAEARTQEERTELWQKEVREDIYIREGINVLQDMIAAQTPAQPAK